MAANPSVKQHILRFLPGITWMNSEKMLAKLAKVTNQLELSSPTCEGPAPDALGKTYERLIKSFKQQSNDAAAVDILREMDVKTREFY